MNSARKGMIRNMIAEEQEVTLYVIYEKWGKQSIRNLKVDKKI